MEWWKPRPGDENLLVYRKVLLERLTVGEPALLSWKALLTSAHHIHQNNHRLSWIVKKKPFFLLLPAFSHPPPFKESHLLPVFFAATALYCRIAPAGSYLMEDPITHEKWALFCNGWLNPEALRSGHEKPLKRRDDAEVMICLLLISFFLRVARLPEKVECVVWSCGPQCWETNLRLCLPLDLQMRGVTTLCFSKEHRSCHLWTLASRIKSRLMDGEETLGASREISPFLSRTEATVPPLLEWQPDKLVLKKLAGNQRTPFARNYWTR